MLEKIGKFIVVLIEILIIIVLLLLILGIGYFFLYRGEEVKVQQGLATIKDITPIESDNNIEENKTIIDNMLTDIKSSIFSTTATTVNTKPEEIVIDSRNYYANQLDTNAKIIYQTLYENKDNLKTGIYDIKLPESINNLLYETNGDEILSTAFQDAWDAFIYDQTDMFFIDTNKICLTTKTTTIGFKKMYEVCIGRGDNDNYLNDKFNNSGSVLMSLQQIDNVKKYILSNCYGSDEDKIRQIHDWLVENLEYDVSTNGENAYNIYGALVQRSVVCEGYAKAFKTLMDEIDIPCILVKGIGTNSNGETEKHMWNYVYLNNNWYAIDVTWDDPIIEGNGFVQNSVHYKYYLKGGNEFLQTHQELGQISTGGKIFTYPVLNENNY